MEERGLGKGRKSRVGEGKAGEGRENGRMGGEKGECNGTDGAP